MNINLIISDTLRPLTEAKTSSFKMFEDHAHAFSVSKTKIDMEQGQLFV